MKTHVWIMLIAVFLSACGTVPVTTRNQGPVANATLKVEARLNTIADDYDKQMEKSGSLINDPLTRQYLQSVLDRLYPEFKQEMQIYLVNSSDLNAFMLPNGSLYMNVGLLARLENEAQLATVLAHEGAHYVDRHSIRQRNQVKNADASRLLLAMTGIPLLPELLTASSIYGYSRELETIADEMGFKRMLAAGYATDQASLAFSHLLEEVEAYDLKQPWFFATHPKLQRRIRNFETLHLNTQQVGEYGSERYQENLISWRLAAMEQDLKKGRYQSILAALRNPQRRSEYPPQSEYYLAEAYRLRGEAGDIERAESHFLNLLKHLPQHWQSHRALGVLYYRQKQPLQARVHLNRYLELSAENDAYVVGYLTKIREQLNE